MDGLQMLDINTNEPINDMQNLEQDPEAENLSIASDIEHAIVDAGDTIKKDVAGAACTYVTPNKDVYNLAGTELNVGTSPKT